MSLRIPSSFLLTQLVVVFLCDIQLAAAESSMPFEYKGLLGHMTIQQAKDYDGHSLTCETDAVVPALVRCHDHSTTYLGKPAILKLEFIDGNLAMLNLLVSAEHFGEVSRSVLGRYGKPRRHGTETDGPKPYEHMEWTLADGELILDEWIARFNPADQRFATVLGLKFLPTALEKRRAEVAWTRHRAIEERKQADM
jgi:hypothetical protein